MVISHFSVNLFAYCLFLLDVPLSFLPVGPSLLQIVALPLFGPSLLGVGEEAHARRHSTGEIVDILEVQKCLYSILQPIY